MKKILVLILVLGILLTACMSEKQQVEAVHKQTINAILQGDAKTASATFSQDYMDVGDNAKKSMSEEAFTNLFNSEVFKQNLQGKKIDDLFELNKKEVYTYEEFVKSNHKDFGKGNFELKQGDIFVYYPNKVGAVLSDGFVGVYRKDNGRWKIIAGD